MTATCWCAHRRVLAMAGAVLGLVAWLAIGCGGGGGEDEGEFNRAPVINSLTANPTAVQLGEQSQLDCDATDRDGDALQYAWTASAGAVVGNGDQATWTAPGTDGYCTVTCTVSDGKSKAVAAETVGIQVGQVTVTGDWFVSPGGDDDDDGRTTGSAFRTISKAVGVADPGDTITILPGTYSEQVDMRLAGGAGQAIVIRGHVDGQAKARPVLDGRRTLAFGVRLRECRNIVIENLEVKDFKTAGIEVLTSSDIRISNNVVHDNGFAPTYGGSISCEGYGINADEVERITIDGNETYGNGPGPACRDTDNLGTGINTYELRDSVIRANHSHHNIGGGILVEDSRNVLVVNNLVEENDLKALTWWDGGLWVDGGRDITVRDNVFRHNIGPGIQISDEDNQNPTGYVLEDNLITENYYGIYIWNFGVCPFPGEGVLRMTGNEIVDNTRRDIWCER